MARRFTSPTLPGFQHINGNLLCAVDVETTGLIPGHHDIWQVAILPLDANVKPLKSITPFYIDLKVQRPENINRKAVKLAHPDWLTRQQYAIEPFTAADLLDEWFERLGLPLYKKICPLAQNFPFDRSFLIEWLGIESFEHIFSPQYRDLMVAALFCNDVSDFKSERIDFAKVNLQYLCNLLGVKNLKAHDSLQDAAATAECYRRLILQTI